MITEARHKCRMISFISLAILLARATVTPNAEKPTLPPAIVSQIPAGYIIRTSSMAAIGGQTFYFVALRSKKELAGIAYLGAPDSAPARPLLIYERNGAGAFLLVGRNDEVIDRAGDGGVAGNGCDPFEGGRIAVKGGYFTVENAIACGAHWTDFVTFRFDRQAGVYVFDNARFTSWTLGHGAKDAPKPEDRLVTRARAGRPIPFSSWRRPQG